MIIEEIPIIGKTYHGFDGSRNCRATELVIRIENYVTLHPGDKLVLRVVHGMGGDTLELQRIEKEVSG